MALAYGLLGPLTVSRDGRLLDLGAPKQRLVLALLLLERGRVVSTDRLVAAAWPQDAPPSAVPSLQAYLSNLRRLLREPDVDGSGRATPLVRQAPGYRLDVSGTSVDLDDYLDAVQVQAEAVQRHDWTVALAAGERARGLWRGPLLVDLADEDWVQAEATALDERRARSRADAVVAHAATGDLGTALEVARALADEHPWRDDVAGLLVRVLARAGRTTEALDAYRAYADGLADELGLDPGQELRALQQAVLRGDGALTAWPDGSAPARSRTPPVAPTPPEVPTSSGASDRFVGRAGLLAALDEVLARGRSGRTAWAVLSGRPASARRGSRRRPRRGPSGPARPSSGGAASRRRARRRGGRGGPSSARSGRTRGCCSPRRRARTPTPDGSSSTSGSRSCSAARRGAPRWWSCWTTCSGPTRPPWRRSRRWRSRCATPTSPCW